MLLPPDELNDIVTHVPSVVLDIRYAAEHNFTGIQLYNHQLAWLRHEPLEALMKAADELAADGYRLVVFDAFRPPSVQTKLRAVCADSDYVAEISNHCRGITVDLTLADAYGVYLDMGTDYDDFSPTAHRNSPLVTREQTLNRQLLADTMQKLGFVEHPYEWWHFDYRPDQSWEIIHDESNAYAP